MSDSFKIDLSVLEDLHKRIKSPTLIAKIENLPLDPGVIALVIQAINDNFAKEGPGWPPLQAKTIRQSVSKKKKKELSQMTDKELLRFEEMARLSNKVINPNRMMLQKTRMLKGSVTQAGAAHNIHKQEGSTLVWGTDLSYAGIHNNGGVIQHPGTDRGFGIPGLKIKPHPINIPKREFLFLAEEWKIKLYNYVLARVTKYVMAEFIQGM